MLIMYVKEAEDGGTSAELPCYDSRVFSVRCMRALSQCMTNSSGEVDARSVLGDVLEMLGGVCKLESDVYAYYQCDVERLLLATFVFWQRHDIPFGGALALLITSVVEAALDLPHMMLHRHQPVEHVEQIEHLTAEMAAFIVALGRSDESPESPLVKRLVGALGGVAKAQACVKEDDPPTTGDALVRACLENLSKLCRERGLADMAMPVLLQRSKEILVSEDSTRTALVALMTLIQELTLETTVVERWLEALPPSATDAAPSQTLCQSTRPHLLILYSPLVDLAGGHADGDVRAHAMRLLKLVGAEIGIGELWLFA